MRLRDGKGRRICSSEVGRRGAGGSFRGRSLRKGWHLLREGAQRSLRELEERLAPPPERIRLADPRWERGRRRCIHGRLW
jgi:hypothetical protein